MREWYDFNGDGIVDAGEEYLAFRVWEEMNGIDGEAPEEDKEE